MDQKAMFELWDVIRHKDGSLHRIVGVPGMWRIADGDVPAYAYESEDGVVRVRPQSKMEDGQYTLEREIEDSPV